MTDKKTPEERMAASLSRAEAATRRENAWQQVQKEDAAAAKKTAEKTARLRALRVAKEEEDRVAKSQLAGGHKRRKPPSA